MSDIWSNNLGKSAEPNKKCQPNKMIDQTDNKYKHWTFGVLKVVGPVSTAIGQDNVSGLPHISSGLPFKSERDLKKER